MLELETHKSLVLASTPPTILTIYLLVHAIRLTSFCLFAENLKRAEASL